MKSGLIILIPAYQPENQLLSLLEEAKKDEFQILIVDDGSDGNSRQIFQSAVQYGPVLHHAQNRG